MDNQGELETALQTGAIFWPGSPARASAEARYHPMSRNPIESAPRPRDRSLFLPASACVVAAGPAAATSAPVIGVIDDKSGR